jgi:hypothetical protein
MGLITLEQAAAAGLQGEQTTYRAEMVQMAAAQVQGGTAVVKAGFRGEARHIRTIPPLALGL